MAEAGGVDVQTNTGRFFCHKCNEELAHVLEDFTCPKCKGGFVEKLSDIPPSAALGGGNIGPGHGMNNFQEGIPFLELIRGLTSSMEVPPPSGQSSRTSGTASGARSPDMNFSFVMDMRPRNNSQPGGGAAGGSQATAGQNAQPPYNPMENMLFSFLNDLITGLSGGGGGVTVGGGFPMLANLGDYVWGRDGLDAIVTQLMNQMEGTGPPPMPTDKLDRIPSVRISQEQVDRKLQCSVCWEDFQLNDEVKQLECDHVFHPDCIVPWLKLHGTCPICRKDLTNADDASSVPSARFEPPGQDNSRSNDSLGGSSRGQGRSNNDLDRMDFEFD
ncbi:unnamed protein product [Orchesella dallaii]|uniref:RING-type domain-containing protein n=1 Tax=Orchesella dallaii TaxID=48710 RepID=A0ABP1R8N9_9HEXA